MSILVDKNTKVITQGMTGSTGTFHTEQALAYGTQMVAGVTPGKGGTTHIGLPNYNTVAEAKAEPNRLACTSRWAVALIDKPSEGSVPLSASVAAGATSAIHGILPAPTHPRTHPYPHLAFVLVLYVWGYPKCHQMPPS